MLSSTGTWFRNLAAAILVYRLTESAFMLGVAGFAQFAAVFVLAPWAGAAADRFDRRRTFAVSQSCALLLTAGLALLTAVGEPSVGVVLAFLLALGVTAAFATPAMLALVPSLVPVRQLAPAIALNSVTFNVARAVGPVLAALVIEGLSVAWAFGISAVACLASIAGVLVVKPLRPYVPPAERPRLRESLELVARNRRLLALLYVVAAVSLASDPAATLGPALVTGEFDRSDSVAGFLVGAFGAGAIVAAFTIAPLLRSTWSGIATTMALAGAGVVVLSISPVLWLALAGLFLAGLGYLSANTAATTRLHLEVEETQRGRVMALWTIAFLGVRPLGSLLDGVIASAAGVRAATFVMALPALLGAVAIPILLRRARG
jgi:MFS family permease